MAWSVLKRKHLSLEWPRYGLNGPGFEWRWQQDFPYKAIPAPRPTQPTVERVTTFFPGSKVAGAWR